MLDHHSSGLHDVMAPLPPPRNMASMLTPLKCVAPTTLTTTMTPAITTGVGHGGKTAPSDAAASSSSMTASTTEDHPQQRSKPDTQQQQPRQRDNGATQITSLVSRFSAGFSGLTNSKPQQFPKSSDSSSTSSSTSSATNAIIDSVNADSIGQQQQSQQQQQQLQQQHQQQNGASPSGVTVNDISSVSICSALIKESFDVLSRPSLLTMSV